MKTASDPTASNESSLYQRDTRELCDDLIKNHPDADIRVVTDQKAYSGILNPIQLLHRLIYTADTREIYAAEAGWSILATRNEALHTWDIEERMDKTLFAGNVDEPWKANAESPASETASLNHP